MCMKYCIRLRRTEFYLNTGKKVRYLFSKFLLNRLQIKTGLLIPPNTCGEGLSIAHLGPIIINGDSRVGSNLRIHVGVNIGANGGTPPVIGDNCYIGPGAKLFGEIIVVNGVYIGANAVVNRDCLEANGVYVGVPAKFVKYKEK